MSPWHIALIVVMVLGFMSLAVRVVRQYERWVVLRFGRLAERPAGRLGGK